MNTCKQQMEKQSEPLFEAGCWGGVWREGFLHIVFNWRVNGQRVPFRFSREISFRNSFSRLRDRADMIDEQVAPISNFQCKVYPRNDDNTSEYCTKTTTSEALHNNRVQTLLTSIPRPYHWGGKRNRLRYNKASKSLGMHQNSSGECVKRGPLPIYSRLEHGRLDLTRATRAAHTIEDEGRKARYFSKHVDGGDRP